MTLSIDITPYIQPGIYEIVCIKNFTSYIGETENLVARLGKHSASLKQCQHDCIALQNDWNTFGPDGFQFLILEFGDACKHIGTRIEKEKTTLQTRIANKQNVYNTYLSETPKINKRRQIQINEKQYQSIAEAAKKVLLSETTIQRRLRDPNYPDYKQLETIKYGYTTVCIGTQQFESISQVVSKGLAKDRFQVYRRINSKSKKWTNWAYTTNKI